MTDVNTSKTEGERERHMTDRGRAYNLDVKLNERKKTERILARISQTIENLMNSGSTDREVKPEYAKWLDAYECYLKLSEDGLELYTDETDREEFRKDCRAKGQSYQNFKGTVEAWFIKTTVVYPEDSVSAVSHRTRASSVISVERARESQKRAELLARQEGLKETRKLEEAKLNLKLAEEEHKIKVEQCTSTNS